MLAGRATPAALHNICHNYVMIRTTIMADEQVLDRLRAIARQQGVSLADVIRDALERRANEFRPRPRSLGIGASGRTTTASRDATEPAPPRSWR